jgi:hypothetical protein
LQAIPDWLQERATPGHPIFHVEQHHPISQEIWDQEVEVFIFRPCFHVHGSYPNGNGNKGHRAIPVL